MVNDFKGDPEAPPTPAAEKGAPYDINDYAKTADNLARAAVELRDATQELRNLIASDDLQETVDLAEGTVTHLLNRVALYGALLIACILAAAITYRIAANRMKKSPA